MRGIMKVLGLGIVVAFLNVSPALADFGGCETDAGAPDNGGCTIPEPSSIALLALGGAAVALAVRRGRREK